MGSTGRESTTSSTAMRTFEAKLVELSREVRDEGLVLAAEPQALDTLQEVTDHLVNDGRDRKSVV